MPTGERMVVQGQATRLRVFAFCKDFMERYHRAPTSHEAGAELGIDHMTAWRHLKALDGADGLLLSTQRAPSKKLTGDEYAPGRAGPVSGRVADVVELFERSGAL